METKSKSKKSAASRKQVSELTLLRAIEMVVEVSKDSKLSDRSMKKMWFLLELHHLVITQFMGLKI